MIQPAMPEDVGRHRSETAPGVNDRAYDGSGRCGTPRSLGVPPLGPMRHRAVSLV